jgi:hypothetical protein
MDVWPARDPYSPREPFTKVLTSLSLFQADSSHLIHKNRSAGVLELRGEEYG